MRRRRVEKMKRTEEDCRKKIYRTDEKKSGEEDEEAH
jgi:hypothetical protein